MPEWLKIRGAGKDAQKKARDFLTNAWNSSELKDSAEHLSAEWKIKLWRCIDAEGTNNFRG